MATGPGSINAESYQVEGAEMLFKDAGGDAAVDADNYAVAGRQALRSGTVSQSIKYSLGATATDEINSQGKISWKASNMRIDTNGQSSMDDLDTITATEAVAGDFLILRSTNAMRVITVLNGAGNILCQSNITLDNPSKTLMLMFDGSNWLRVAGP